MEVFNKCQYNQGVGKYKLLSSTAGVGSIITTKMGYFVMPKSVSEWTFLKSVSNYVKDNPDDNTNFSKIAKQNGVEIICDIRFVEFLKNEEDISNLKCLVAVPHVSLTEKNYPRTKEHPINVEYKERKGSYLSDEHFLIPAIHFPCWFYSRKGGYLKSIDEWKDLWKRKYGDSCLRYFAPPRDANDKSLGRTFYDNGQKKDICTPLVQVPMVLLCENGHISDIPWYKLFCALLNKEDLSSESTCDLFGYECIECTSGGGKHEIQWIENRNQSESWGVLKCKKCSKVVSLEGIMNIKPYCNGETPWKGNGVKDTVCMNMGTRSRMRFALVTSNSVYYADCFSSLYIPLEYLPNAPLVGKLGKVLELLEMKWFPKELEKNVGLTREHYIESLDLKDKADDSEIALSDEDVMTITNKFLEKMDSVINPYEQYRFDEYYVFKTMDKSLLNNESLTFNDITLPIELSNYFSKIQQISSLTVTSTQLSFSRVKMPEMLREVDGKIRKKPGQPIFSSDINEVYALPANQEFGEGLFFDFNTETVIDWCNSHEDVFKDRYEVIQPGELAQSLYNEMQVYGFAKFYLLHTFSHIIMRELEFSCGYPTASLKERLYYSDRMNGVLIYTAEGSEGSMGGLVWQGQPKLILDIINQAMDRAKNCSSDPLCWESDSQLNLAACFSCCLVSETSCEQRNLGLDRQILVNEEFGYFKS